jgi:DNA-binding beta-propeller fold protein YncE
MAANKIPAPEFPQNMEWLNVDKPLTMKDLHGKVVLLDFWCFCCINCMHVIPDLHRLETKYGNALEIVGVHSAKYVAEHDSDNIRAAILRYDIEHPVVNDRNFAIWNLYGIHAWPSFILIDPDGNAIGILEGEGAYDAFDQKIGELVKQYDAAGKINRAPIALKLEKDHSPPTPLLFPGKLAADDGKLYISDSNHNRIVVLNLADRTILQTIGDGKAGLKDGSFAQAEFYRPQGVAVAGDKLYVADTENHAVRVVDLKAGKVSTIAGNGKQGALSSPWDVLVHDNSLLIAMAGHHQIGAIDLRTSKVEPFAGSGLEDISDAPLAQAAFAQPSGLTTDGKQLFSADSETSSIRAMDFDAGGSVRTVVGKGLFDFGDVDGKRETARLQHALGVCWQDGLLYVADTYNNKIKTVNPETGETHTLIGTGHAGFADGNARLAELNEPSGLTFADGKLYIADTNNHLIRVFDPATGTVDTLHIAAAESLMPASDVEPFSGTVRNLGKERVGPGSAKLELNVTVPKEYKLNAAAPFYFGVSIDGKMVAERNAIDPKFPVTIPLDLKAGVTNLTVDMVIYYCDADREAFCRVKRLRYMLPVESTPLAAKDTVRIEAAP